MRKLMINPVYTEAEKWNRIAKELDAAFEYDDFFMPSLIANPTEYRKAIDTYKALNRDTRYDTLHGCFFDIVLNSQDEEIKRTSRERMILSMETAKELGCRAVIFHTNYIVGFKSNPYRDSWVKESALFYRYLLDKYPTLEIYVENMYDDSPEMIKRLAEQLKNESRFGLCLDIAHASLWNTPVNEWIEELGCYIKHIHANDNRLDEDSHMAIGSGLIDWNILNDRRLLANKPSLLIEVNSEEKLRSSYNYLLRHCLYPYNKRNSGKMQITGDVERILALGRELTAQKDYNKLLEEIVDEAMEIADCDAATLYIFKDEQLRFMILRNHSLGVYRGGNGDPIDLPPVNLDEKYVCAYCAIHKEIINVDDVYTDERFDWKGPREYDSLTGYRTKSMLVVPLENHEGIVIGVLQLMNAFDNKGNVCNFDKNNLSITSSLASQAAISLSNMMMINDLKRLLNSFVMSMTTAIDARTPYNANHTIHVAQYCEDFCNYIIERSRHGECDIKLTENDREQLVMAARLHDIGKMIIPLEVMNKSNRLGNAHELMQMRWKCIRNIIESRKASGELTEEEYRNTLNDFNSDIDFVENVNIASFLSDDMSARIDILKDKCYTGADGEVFMFIEPSEYEKLCIRKGTLTSSERKVVEQHVEYTSKILSGIPFGDTFRNVKFIAGAHHEYLDGSGYPIGLNAEQLPVTVRILTIMDVFDSLSSDDRPYRRRSLTQNEIFGILDSMCDEGKLDRQLVNLTKTFFGQK